MVKGDRLNYGLALSHAGDFQVIDTVHLPGIRDDYSILLSGPFTYFVAPHQFVDQYFSLDNLSNKDYYSRRQSILKSHAKELKDCILKYHGVQIKSNNTWAD
jgi:hypothetical protein